MKKWLCLLMAMILAVSVPALAENGDDDDGDDSVALLLDELDEAEIETEVQAARVLELGCEGDDVLYLQIRLEDLKYYSGELSGKFGTDTRDAVKAFQKDYQLDASGIADVQTQILISTAQYRTVQYGSSGEDVKEIQTRLTALGYYKGKISGNFLEGTRSAIEKFQTNNNLPKTGIADPVTQQNLFSLSAVSKSDVAEPTPTPISDLANYLVNEDENGPPMPESPVAFTKKLKSGSSGKLVRQLQERMAGLGYYDGPISGNFQKNTVRAVKKIQTQNGMEASGVVDEDTWNVIFNNARIVMPDATPKPTPSPEPIPFAITVDVKNQIVSVYGRDEDGEYTVPVRQMLCSTGKVGTDSPVGDWVLNGRKAAWCKFPTWGDYARYWTRINSSVAFHSPIYRSVSNTDMKVSSYNKLGQRASHGCIRLSVPDAKWIYDNVGAGTVVSIVEGMEPDPELKAALKLPPLNTKYMTPIATPTPTAEPDYRSMEKPDLQGKVLKKKSSSEAVYWVQCRLKELGYYTTKCTGTMLDRTQKALKAFQRDHGLHANGEANQAVIDALWEAEVPTKAPKASPTPAPIL